MRHPSGPPTLTATPSPMRITISESGGRTSARVELAWGGTNLAGTGVAYRHPSDHLNDHTRQEMATARALSDLAGPGWQHTPASIKALAA